MRSNRILFVCALALAMGGPPFEARADAQSALLARNRKAIRKVFSDTKDPARRNEERILTFIVESEDPDEVKTQLLDENLQRLNKLAGAYVDSDGDGLNDLSDPLPMVAACPLYWVVESFSVGWRPEDLDAAGGVAKLAELVAEAPVRAEFVRAAQVRLYERQNCGGEQAGRASAASAHPLAGTRAGQGTAAHREALQRFSLFGSGCVAWNGVTGQRAAQAAAVAERVAEVTRDAPTWLQFRLRFQTLDARPIRCRAVEIPVELDGRVIGWAIPVEVAAREAGFVIPEQPAGGLAVDFSLVLDRRAARHWLERLIAGAPQIAVTGCRGRILAGDGDASTDVTALMRRIVSRTVALTVDGGDGCPLVWRMARELDGARMRVTDALAVLNRVSMQAAGQPVLAGKDGWPLSLASWDNGSWDRWWWIRRGGRDVTRTDWTGEPMDRDVLCTRSDRWPPLAEAALKASDPALSVPGIDSLRGRKAWLDGRVEDALQWYGRSAAAGFAPSQTWLGYALLEGRGGATNRAAAAGWFRMAADQHYAPGETWLGICQLRGYGMPRSPIDALGVFLRAAGQGYPEAQARVGLCMSQGVGSAADPIEAEVWLRRAAGQDYAAAQVALGRLLLSRSAGSDVSAQESAFWFERAAAQGDVAGQTLLARACYEGRGRSRDPAAAVKWYRSAAQQGSASAQAGLGRCYFEGQGVRRDLAAAVVWLRQAAELGDPDGQQWFALCLLQGRGTAADPAAGVVWLGRAADQNLAPAQVLHGLCLQRGLGVAADPVAAAGRFRQAAEQGHAAGQIWLGYCYLNGLGLARDPDAARKWFARAEAQGVPLARQYLEQVPSEPPATPLQ